MNIENWIENFQGLNSLPPDLKNMLVSRSRIMRLPDETRVFGPDYIPDHLLLLLEGTVRVSQISENGREIVLYRVEAGQSCVMTTACLLLNEAYSAEGFAEGEIKAVSIPRSMFDELIASSSRFRDFVFTAYARRITDLFRVIDEVAFGKIDVRLAQKLLQLTGENSTLNITHQQLATELGTAREVVSRQLSEFQRKEWLKLSRGSIVVLDKNALKKICHS